MSLYYLCNGRCWVPAAPCVAFNADPFRFVERSLIQCPVALPTRMGTSEVMDRSLTTPQSPTGVTSSDADQAPARRYQLSARSENTLRACRASLARFASWCAARDLEAVPATPETVAAFLATEADSGCSAATVALRAAAIAFAHRTAERASPCDSPTVTETLRGIRREHAIERAEHRRASALTAERLATCLGTLDRATLRGKRDAALLTLGFALGARRSELVALSVDDLRDDGEGLHVRMRRSKTDQAGEGADLYVPMANNARLCATRAVRDWLEATGVTTRHID